MNQTNATTRSTLALLRALVPQRELSHYEALRIAELQANRRYSNSSTSRRAPSLMRSYERTELPRVRIERESWLPVSGPPTGTAATGSSA